MKIIQITDTHFSPNKPHFNGNWAPLLTWIEATGADLIVHTGDLTVDGADKDEDITFSMDLMRQVSIPMLIVPGNHDVGHFQGSGQPVNAERLARWRSLAETTAGWRIRPAGGMLDSDEAKTGLVMLGISTPIKGRAAQRRDSRVRRRPGAPCAPSDRWRVRCG